MTKYALVLALCGLWIAGGLMAAPPGLVSWWPGEGNGDDVQDGNHGVVVGNTSFVPGQVGLAFSFDGSLNTGVIVGDRPALESVPWMSVDAWVCTTNPEGDRGIITQHYSREFGNTPSWVLRTYWRNDLGRVGFGVNTNQGMTITGNELQSLTMIADGAFHHVAGTYDGQVVRLYVDGVLEDWRALTGLVNNSTNEVVIGNYGSGNHPTPAPELWPSFEGLIDEVRFFDRALTPEEIQATYGAVNPRRCDLECPFVPEPASQGFWHRQCLGLPANEGGIDPGRNGRGPQEPTEPGFSPGLTDCASAVLEGLGFYGMETCEAIDAQPANDECERALKQTAAVILNVCSGRLAADCEIDVADVGCSSSSVGELLDELGSLIFFDDCQQAMSCAAMVNDGGGLVDGGGGAPSTEINVGPSRREQEARNKPSLHKRLRPR